MSSAADSVEGLLDTNVVIHAWSTDSQSEECRRFLTAIEQGELHVRLEPMVLHELTYALPRYVQQLTRRRTAEYLVTLIGWPGVTGDKGIMVAAIERWERTPRLGFVDAYLAALAEDRGCPVYTKNLREFSNQGVDVPNPLPDGEGR